MRMTDILLARRRAPILQVVKSAVATIGAWFAASLLIPGPPPVFAAIAALLVVQPSLNQSFAKAVERTVGVVAGVAIASALGLVLGDASWVVIVATVAALIIAWLLRMAPGAANQIAISALLVLAIGTSTPSYAVDRILETLVGAAIGLIVNVVLVPPVAVAPAHRAVDALGTDLAGALTRLAAALGGRRTRAELDDLLAQARAVRETRDAAHAAIGEGTESLALNPRGRRHRDELRALDTLLDGFSPVVVQTIGMTRAFVDRYDDALADEPAMGAIAEQLRRAAHDVELALRRADASASAAVVEPAALTTPLTVGRPASDHWILIGSLLEDLRRIHETVGELA